MVTKFIGKAPVDTLWVSDSWLPNGRGRLDRTDRSIQIAHRYNSDVDQFCIDSMSYNGKQYGITYYTDFMASSTRRDPRQSRHQGAAADLG